MVLFVFNLLSTQIVNAFPFDLTLTTPAFVSLQPISDDPVWMQSVHRSQSPEVIDIDANGVGPASSYKSNQTSDDPATLIILPYNQTLPSLSIPVFNQSLGQVLII